MSDNPWIERAHHWLLVHACGSRTLAQIIADAMAEAAEAQLHVYDAERTGYRLKAEAAEAQLAQLVAAAREAYDKDEVCYLNAVLAEIDAKENP